jgi:hypothetical protein
MNRQTKEFLISYPLISGVLWVTGAISNATFNIMDWGQGSRTLISIAWFAFISVVTFAILSDTSKPNQ